MRWLVVTRPELPIFSGIVIVRTGGADEEIGKTGLAHMFEHMAFKGSKDIKANEAWEALTRRGATDLNAFTSKDITGYHASMPVQQFSLWAYLTSEMVFFPAMRDFYKERDVVMEEWRLRYDNSPQGTVTEALLHAAFPDGPYHTSPIGEPKDVSGLTVDDAFQFHHQHYLPQNMVGVLVGAIPLAEAKSQLERFFGRLKKDGKSPEEKPLTYAFKGEAREKVSFPAEESLLIAFHKPSAPARDDYVFDMLNGLLCDGRTSRFYQKLVQEKKLASNIYCSNSFPGSRYENLFVIFADPNKGHSLGELEGALTEELEKVRKEVGEEELQKVRAGVLYEYFWGLEDNLHLAEELAVSQAVLKDWRYTLNYPKVLETITKEEVSAVAAKYFVPENRVVVERKRGKRK